MLELFLIFLFIVVYAVRTRSDIDDHYNAAGFSDEERRFIVMKYYEQHPEEAQAFISAEPHVQAQMIIKIMEDLEDAMKKYPAKWWRVTSGKTIIDANNKCGSESAI